MRTIAIALALLAAAPALAADGTPPAPATSAAAPLTLSLMGPVLYVVDPDKALAFYRDGLGMQLAMTLDHGTRREYMMRFSGDFSAPGIILLHDSAPDAPRALEHGNAYQRVVLRTSNLEALASRLDAAGFAHGPIRGTSNAYRMMMASDPEGYRLELVQSGGQP